MVKTKKARLKPLKIFQLVNQQAMNECTQLDIFFQKLKHMPLFFLFYVYKLNSHMLYFRTTDVMPSHHLHY